MVEENNEDIEELFSCKYCKYQTPAIDDLDEHIVEHDEALLEDDHGNNISNRETTSCSITLEDSSFQLETNFKESNGNLILLACPYCKYLVESRIEMKRHIREHIDPTGVFNYVCSECPYNTVRRSDITKHLFIHINDQNPSKELPLYKCEMCSYTTIKKWCLQKHMLVHKNPNGAEIFTCKCCKYFTKRRSDMVKHLKIHSK